MSAFDVNTVRISIAVAFATFGCLFLLVGLWKVAGYQEVKQLKRLAAHAQRASQRKDLLGDANLLTQSASSLADAIDRLVRNSSTGAGAFLILVGTCMLTGSIFILPA
jgi:hypothetical protein